MISTSPIDSDKLNEGCQKVRANSAEPIPLTERYSVLISACDMMAIYVRLVFISFVCVIRNKLIKWVKYSIHVFKIILSKRHIVLCRKHFKEAKNTPFFLTLLAGNHFKRGENVFITIGIKPNKHFFF